MSDKWIQLITPPGMPETAARMQELPGGPYFLIPQHKEEDFMRNFLNWKLDPKKEFTLHYGHATYAIDIDTGMPLKVGYHYDCSG